MALLLADALGLPSQTIMCTYAKQLGVDYAVVYERMKAVGMIENYIIPHYDVLHTESRENVTAGMIETLTRWEEKQ